MIEANKLTGYSGISKYKIQTITHPSLQSVNFNLILCDSIIEYIVELLEYKVRKHQDTSKPNDILNSYAYFRLQIMIPSRNNKLRENNCW